MCCHPTNELVLVLPSVCQIDGPLAVRTLEDVATWMGVSDDQIRLLDFSVTPPPGEEAGAKGPKVHLTVRATLHKEPQRLDAPASPEPVVLAEGILEEWQAGRLAVGLTLTKRDVAHAVGATLCCGRAPRGCAEAERRRVKPLTMVETEAADADSTRAEEAQGAAVGGAANPCAGRYVADDAAPVDPSVKVPDGGR